MRTRWYMLCIAVLAVFNAVLLVQNYRLKNSILEATVLTEPSEYMARTLLPDVAVLDKSGHAESILQVAGARLHTLLVFFSPNDCPACFDERRLWSQIEARTGVPVVGIASSSDPRELYQWLKANEIVIDVYVDTLGAIDQYLELTRTPLKVLVNSQGSVIWADPTREVGPTMISFWEEFESVVDRQEK